MTQPVNEPRVLPGQIVPAVAILGIVHVEVDGHHLNGLRCTGDGWAARTVLPDEMRWSRRERAAA